MAHGKPGIKYPRSKYPDGIPGVGVEEFPEETRVAIGNAEFKALQNYQFRVWIEGDLDEHLGDQKELVYADEIASEKEKDRPSY